MTIIYGLGMASLHNLFDLYINNRIDYNEWKPELGNKFETDIASTFYNKFKFVNLNGAIRNILRQPEMNGVVKLNNGYLLTTMPYCSDETLQQYAYAVAEFGDYLRNRGTYLVFASTPYTCNKYDPQLPEGVLDYGNDNIDRFMDYLNDLEVDTIDFRESMFRDEIDQYSMMYKTDHHWTTEAGLYAYNILEEHITEKTGCEVDPRISDIENYSVTKYKEWHLGSRGQRTGVYYAGIDDYDLIIPSFETCLQDSRGEVGSVEDLMLDMTALESRDYTSRYTYDTVWYDSLGSFSNLNCENDIRILFITDSFGRVVSPYLSMAYSQVYYIYNQDLNEVTPEFIEDYDPDVVVMLYYPECISEESVSFEFNGF